MQITAGITLPWINDLGKAGDELFHDDGPTLNPTLGIQPAAVPQAPTSPHKSHMRFPWLGDRVPCKRLASGRLHRNADDGRIALSQSGGDPEEGRPCPYRGNPGVHTAA